MSQATDSQSAAIRARGNVLVVAGAGTGKTRTLVDRCLALVSGGCSLENILMVTFTEAAAAEMRQRLRGALRAKLAECPRENETLTPALSLSERERESPQRAPSPRTGGGACASADEGQGEGSSDLVEHLEKQLALLDTAHISTLHGFCLQLVRERFYELGIDPEVNVLDAQQTQPLIEETLDTLFERAYAGDDAGAAAIQELVRVYGHGADGPVRALVVRLHRYTQSLPDPQGWFDEQLERFEQGEPVQWREWLLEGFSEWRALWLPVLRPLAQQVANAAGCVAALEAAPVEPSLSGVATALHAIQTADQSAWPHGTKTTLRKSIERFFSETDFLGSLALDAAADPLAEDWRWVRPHMTALLQLAQQFTAEFSRAKRELAGVDFADLEQFALRLLREPATGAPTPVARRWQQQFEYIFVDEYQDITAAQDAILTALGREGDAANRFLVGDVKQSIYRFRLAAPTIFTEYEQRWRSGGGEGQRIPLAENFRSREAILDFVNALFAALMRPAIGGVTYEELHFGDAVNRQPLANAGDSRERRVELHLIAKADAAADNDHGDEPDSTQAELLDLAAIEREARLVALWLRQLKESGHSVWDEDRGEMRPVEWRDMAVLLRSPKGRVEAFAKEFARLRVPLLAERGGFFDSLEITDLVSLLKLLDNPLQDEPLLAVLRSPLVGLALAELAEIRAHNREPIFWMTLQRFHRELRKDEARAAAAAAATAWTKVDVFLRQFTQWRELVRLTSLSHTVETALADTHYEALTLAGPRGEQRVANVRRFLELARQYDPYQRQGLFRFLRFIAAQQEAEVDLEPAAVQGENAVQLLSIHKSKGLEFPVVVVAALGVQFNLQDLRQEILLDERYGVCPRVAPPDGRRRYPSLPHWLARRRQQRETLGEELRLLYVAMTRARDTLVLTGTVAGDGRWGAEASRALNDQEVLAARSYLDWLRLWLPQATRDSEWTSASAGQSGLMQWNLYASDDARLAASADDAAAQTESAAPPSALAPDELQSLLRRVSWQYPFAAAASEPAKRSVTGLVRSLAAADEEAAPIAQVRRQQPAARIRAGAKSAKLSAAEIGTAHHTFLQFVELARVGSVADLQSEAARMTTRQILSAAEAAALDFGALAAFWQSEYGQRIRAHSDCVRREVPFTARFSPTELARLGLTATPQLPTDEFIVVQGVVDLAVMLDQEIWVLDFKTDHLRGTEVEAKTRFYGPQLQLYALALARIHRRPVKETWLHFLAVSRTVTVPA